MVQKHHIFDIFFRKENVAGDELINVFIFRAGSVSCFILYLHRMNDGDENAEIIILHEADVW